MKRSSRAKPRKPVPAEPRFRRFEPDARREQLLEVAVRRFGERPYSAVSTREIAEEAGIARGLLNHYFGSKRDLYLEVVRRMLLLPDVTDAVPVTGSLEARVRRAIDWFLDVVETHGKTFVAVTAGHIGDDPDLERILFSADDVAARKVLEIVGMPTTGRHAERNRAAIRAFSGMVKNAIKEWIRAGTLTRKQVSFLLTETLVAVVRDLLPRLP